MPRPLPDDAARLVAQLVDRAAGQPVLQLDARRGVLGDALAERGADLRLEAGDWPSVQLERRFPVVAVTADGPPEHRRAVLHCAVQHAEPGAFVVLWWADDGAALVHDFDLAPVERLDVDGGVIAVHRRTDRFTVHDLVFEARSAIRRVDPPGLAAALASAAPPLVLDTRTHTDRVRFGVIPGAIHVPRTVLEWHVDPANGHRHPLVRSYDQPMVVVCNGGYSSSLAAHALQRLGFSEIADLIGGHHAWVAAGLPVVPPDHSHLDL